VSPPRTPLGELTALWTPDLDQIHLDGGLRCPVDLEGAPPPQSPPLWAPLAPRFSRFRRSSSVALQCKIVATPPFPATALTATLNVKCMCGFRYVWETLDVGYIQGMCDLLAPLLVVFDDGMQ